MNDKSKSENKSPSEVNSPESLQIAARYVALLGSAPTSFTSVTRALIQAGSKGSAGLASHQRANVNRLIRGPAMQAPLYFAAKLLRQSEFSTLKTFEVSDVLSVYSPSELAALIGLIYFSKKAKAKADADEWGFLGKLIQDRAEIGFLLGNLEKNIGSDIGLLVSAFPAVGMVTFLSHDKGGFKEYRRHLKAKVLTMDCAFEFKKWGCTSVQIAALIVQSIGFGVSFADALCKVPYWDQKPDSELSEDALRIKGAYFGLRRCEPVENFPESVSGTKFMPSSQVVDKLKRRMDEIQESNTKWLFSGREDLTPDSAPLLSGGAPQLSPTEPLADQAPSHAVETPPAAAEDRVLYKDLAPDIQGLISEDEFNALSGEELKQFLHEVSPKEIS